MKEKWPISPQRNVPDTEEETLVTVPLKKRNRVKNNESREGKPKFYCVLNHRYAVGDVIVGRSTNSDFVTPTVFLSDSPAPHHTLSERSDLEKYFIYKVLPLKKVHVGETWGELGSQMVQVLEVLGTAKSFVEHNKYSVVNIPLHQQEHERRARRTNEVTAKTQQK